MRRRLFIVGAGDFGRELEIWLQAGSWKKNWKLAGFLDDNPDALRGYPTRLTVLGSPLNFPFKKNDMVLISIADPHIKAKIYDALLNHVRFYTFIHPNAVIGNYVTIGQGSIICPNAVLTNNVHVGNCVIVNVGTVIGHDVVIADCASLMTNISVSGKCLIGERVLIGSGATILPSMKVGHDSVVGAGSVVVKNVLEHSTIFGNPAVQIKYEKA